MATEVMTIAQISAILKAIEQGKIVEFRTTPDSEWFIVNNLRPDTSSETTRFRIKQAYCYPSLPIETSGTLGYALNVAHIMSEFTGDYWSARKNKDGQWYATIIRRSCRH